MVFAVPGVFYSLYGGPGTYSSVVVFANRLEYSKLNLRSITLLVRHCTRYLLANRSTPSQSHCFALT